MTMRTLIVGGMYAAALAFGICGLWLFAEFGASLVLGAFLAGLLLGIGYGRRKPPVRQAAAPRGEGFTIVEMMIVLVILAILLGMVVGISRYAMAQAARSQTLATQAVAMQAVSRYYDARGCYPPDSPDCVALMNALRAEPAARGVLTDLSNEAYPSQGAALRDGFGEPMQYRTAGGLGGTPVLISKGADRQFDTDDDIRSDEN